MLDYKEKLANARKASKIDTMLNTFFIDETARTLESLLTCPDLGVYEYRAYLKALNNLENNLQAYINTHNIEDLRRRHARD